MKIEVYFCSGEAAAPWLVGLLDGVSITKIYQQFRSPGVAIQYAKNAVAAKVNLPVVWPDGLKVSA